MLFELVPHSIMIDCKISNCQAVSVLQLSRSYFKDLGGFKYRPVARNGTGRGVSSYNFSPYNIFGNKDFYCFIIFHP